MLDFERIPHELEYNCHNNPGVQQPSRKARSQLNPTILLMGVII
jgi:hypothetical protein